MEKKVDSGAVNNSNLDERVRKVIDLIRPALRADGGDVEYLGIEGEEKKYVKVRLTGACGGCPMATVTLKMGIEAAIKEEVPEIEGVIGV